MTPRHPRSRSNEQPFVCRRCDGPARQYLGDKWCWMCQTCVQNELDWQEERYQRAEDERRRQEGAIS